MLAVCGLEDIYRKSCKIRVEDFSTMGGGYSGKADGDGASAFTSVHRFFLGYHSLNP